MLLSNIVPIIGSFCKANMHILDYTYPYNGVKKWCAQNQGNSCILVTTGGANPDSYIHYSRMKGELESTITELPFKLISNI